MGTDMIEVIRWGALVTGIGGTVAVGVMQVRVGMISDQLGAGRLPLQGMRS
jgi:hypothetical protein